jgi:hypothetical protein
MIRDGRPRDNQELSLAAVSRACHAAHSGQSSIPNAAENLRRSNWPESVKSTAARGIVIYVSIAGMYSGVNDRTRTIDCTIARGNATATA